MLNQEHGKDTIDGKDAFILLSDGSFFDYVNPDSTPMSLECLAASLASTSRFRGQTKTPVVGQVDRKVYTQYSVAQHCVLMAVVAMQETNDVEFALACLHHEDGEGPCGDMPSPLKALCPDYAAIEKRCCAAINKQWDISQEYKDKVKELDTRFYFAERDIFMPKVESLISSDMPVPDIKIMPMTAAMAREKFISLHENLMFERDRLARISDGEGDSEENAKA